MSNNEFSFLFNKSDKRYNLVWLAAFNPKEFQRLARIEDFDIERISVQSICDEIILTLSEESNLLVSTEADNRKPMLSFLMASQLFIGLIYVHEQQVKFLCELASRWTLPTKFLIENQPQYVAEGDSPNSPPAKKAVKRKSSSVKERKTLKQKISFDFHKAEEPEDIVTLNQSTAELLQNAFVSNNADISIREAADDYGDEIDEPMDLFDVQFNEVIVSPGRPNFDDADLLPEGLISSLNQEPTVDETGFPRESPRPEHFELVNDTIHEETTDVGKTGSVTGGSPNMLNDEPTVNSMEMESLEENGIPAVANVSTRKRKRNQPFKDRILTIDVKQNMRTGSTTQRHLKSKDDSVSKTTRLNHLSRDIFYTPSHMAFAKSSLRPFDLKHVSDKLLESFKRMTLTKVEETNHNLVNEFCSNRADNTHPEVSVEDSEQSLVDVPIPCHDTELSPQINDVVEASLTLPPIPDMDEMLQQSIVAPPINYQHELVELSPVIRQLLVTNQTSNILNQSITDEQKLFACRSRQNRLDWGTEGVLQKLMSLWNSGTYPIGMKEIMQTHNQRISAATAFFSVMELNSARIGLINIDKSPNSNTIFNIMKSPKFMELQATL